MPPKVMTEQDYESLKAQIKQELLAEMHKEPPRKIRSVWDEIRIMVEERTNHLRGPDQYQVIMAVSTIIRHSTGISQVKYLPRTREEEIKVFVSNLLDQMDELKAGKQTA